MGSFLIIGPNQLESLTDNN